MNASRGGASRGRRITSICWPLTGKDCLGRMNGCYQRGKNFAYPIRLMDTRIWCHGARPVAGAGLTQSARRVANGSAKEMEHWRAGAQSWVLPPKKEWNRTTLMRLLVPSTMYS